ncbi:hypothetical protein T439DRAFT_326646 [Meredithblackwellia eburnea MCA 4105]
MSLRVLQHDIRDARTIKESQQPMKVHVVLRELGHRLASERLGSSHVEPATEHERVERRQALATEKLEQRTVRLLSMNPSTQPTHKLVSEQVKCELLSQDFQQEITHRAKEVRSGVHVPSKRFVGQDETTQVGQPQLAPEWVKDKVAISW